MKTQDISTPTRLVRALGPLTATAVVVGTVIGSGIFRKPHDVARQLDAFVLIALAWVLGGVLAMLGSLAYAEVAVLYPRAGGNYVFLREGYGRLAGFLWGWVDFFVIRSGSIAALATAFADSLHDVLRAAVGSDAFTPWQLRGLTVAVIVALALVNVRGVRWGGFLQLLITTVKVGSLLAILLLPLLVLLLARPDADAARPDVSNLRPFWPESIGANLLIAFGAALLGVQWSYHGWMNVAPVAEEVREPQRNIPIALLVGTAVVILLYLGVNLAYAVVLPASELARPQNKVVVAAFGEALLGPAGLVAASAVVMCSVFGALNGNLLVGPRTLYAMGDDRLAPRFLGAVHPRFHTPAFAILVLAAWACLLVVGVGALKELLVAWRDVDGFDLLTNFSMFGALIFETLAVSTIFVFRRRFPYAARPYRCWGYPGVPGLYVVLLVLVVIAVFAGKPVEALIGVAFIGVGAGVYFTFFAASRRNLPPVGTDVSVPKS